jgi:uncharacterized protein DUF1801
VAGLKTKQNKASVEAFVAGIADEAQRADARRVLALMQKITGEPPKMWGGSMVGFGSYRYQYATGNKGVWFVTGFSPRKGYLSLHLMSGFAQYGPLLKKLGKVKTGKACLSIKRLDDIDWQTLEELVKRSVAHVRKTYGRE